MKELKSATFKYNTKSLLMKPSSGINPISHSQTGLFNFRPSVRPVPLEVHVKGFPGQHYCPRMATMNKPTFQGESRVVNFQITKDVLLLIQLAVGFFSLFLCYIRYFMLLLFFFPWLFHC